MAFNLFNTLKKSVRKWIPPMIKKKIHNLTFQYYLKRQPVLHSKALKRVRDKKVIKVVFFLIHESVWKHDGIYKMMEKNERFHPIIIVCPYITYGSTNMHREMIKTFNSFKNKRYNVIKTFNESTGKWLDVKKEINPDIVFFTNPWDLTRPEYLIQNFKKTLTCYIPYGFKNSYLYQEHFNQPMHNLVWKFFLETDIHKKLSLKYSQNKSINTLVTGYPGMDKLLQKDYNPVDVWKIKDRNIKRIIWAPHHTLPGMGATLDYSTFLKYYDFMLSLAVKYNDLIQIAFKPHPILRSKLSNDKVWGKEKTDEYYEKWAELPNGQIFEGEYIDLFLTSDGLIHDSSSFVIEYLYTNKPVMFLLNNDSVYDRFNEIGERAIKTHYIGKCEEDIISFLKNVIIDKKDLMRDERNMFFNSVIKPPHNRTATENIFKYLKNKLLEN